MKIKFSRILEFSQDLSTVYECLQNSMPGDLEIEVRTNKQAKAMLLDTFDSDLRQSDRILIQQRRNITLLDATSGVLTTQSCPMNWHFTKELPDQPVKSSLADISPLRAMISIAQSNLQVGRLSLLDSNMKTHVRVHLYTFSQDQEEKTVGIVQPLRGYERNCRILLDKLNNENLAVEINIAKIYGIFGATTGIYNAKPAVAIRPDEHAIDVANSIIRAFLNVARQNEPGAIADLDTEFIHDYRVSLRKVRSVLSLFKGVYARKDTDKLKNAFSMIMKNTNQLRDLDVYLLDREAYFSMLPEQLHDGLKVMFDIVADDRSREQRKVARYLGSDEYNETIENLRHLFESPGSVEPGPMAEKYTFDFACQLIQKRYGKVCKIANSITDDTPDEIVHDLRIECKKLRYLMEFFSPLFSKDEVKKLIKSLKIFQDNLGRFNDFSVQQLSLQKLLKTHDDTDRYNMRLAASIGGLITVLNRLQLNERAKVMQNFLAFDSMETKKSFHALFNQGVIE